MRDIADIFSEFGKIFSIELSVKMDPKTKKPKCNGWSLVTFCVYESAQKACFAHLSKRIPGKIL